MAGIVSGEIMISIIILISLATLGPPSGQHQIFNTDIGLGSIDVN